MNRFVQLGLLVCLCILPIQLAGQGQGKGKGKPPREPIIMGNLFYDSFENRIDTTANSRHPWVATSTGTATARTGSRAADLSTGDWTCWNQNFDHDGQPNYWNLSDSYLSFYLRRTGAITDDDQIVIFKHTDSQSSNLKLKLEWATGNFLRIETNTGTTTGATALDVDQWYRIDLHCPTGASALWTLNIDGTTEISATEDVSANTMSEFDIGDIGGTANTIVDDVLLRDDSFLSSDGFRVEHLYPDGNGNYTAWTGDFNDVDEKSLDGTEASTNSQNDRETYTLDNLPTLAAGETVESTMIFGHLRKTVNSAVNVQFIERESATDRDSSSFGILKNDISTDPFRWLIQDTKPTGGAWTESAVNGLEIGVEHDQPQARDALLDVINLAVLIGEPAPSSAGSIYHHFQNLGVY